MAGKTTPVVFITANVGSIFEEPSVMLKIWTQEFLSTIARLDPKFIALHCQEVGGKNYEKSMQHVEDFVQLLVNSYELRLFDKVRIYLDEDYSSAENFTALGNFYFIHESITDALIYNFEARNFVEVSGKEVYSQNIEHVPTKEKSKFPLQYFPECKWSRKGFLRTRWSLNGTMFDLVNVHLFHDASNFVAIESFPSVYSDTRRRALAYTLERFQTDEHGPAPFFLFGDFNFRTDTQGVVKRLSEGLDSSPTEGEVSIIQFKQEDKIILSLGKKEFSHSDHQTIFTAKDGDWLKEFDKELDAFSGQLFEFGITFPPSYPFEENSSGDRCYMKTRCPAWCDRVVLSHSAIPLVKDQSNPGSVEYGLMGRSTCMGDHKPVYLKIEVKGDTAKETFSDATPRGALAVSVPGTVGAIKPNVVQSADSVNAIETVLPEKSNVNPSLKYSELEIEKLACSIEALMSLNRKIGNGEQDLSVCSSCVIHDSNSQNIIARLASEIRIPEGVLKKTDVTDTGQGQETETSSWVLDKLYGSIESKSAIDFDRYGIVKRVNSASMVENKPKKEDWKNSRCNSDVSWSPPVSGQGQDVNRFWRMTKPFNRGNSRVRLISSSNSLNASLPRLTSHHSSSDEEWFEEVTEGDDDVLQMKCNEEATIDGDGEGSVEVVDLKSGSAEPSLKEEEEPTDEVFEPKQDDLPEVEEAKVQTTSRSEEENKFTKLFARPVSASTDPENFDNKKSKKSKPLSILKRLTGGRKDSQRLTESQNETSKNKKWSVTTNRESFENLIVDPSVDSRDKVETKPEEKQKSNCGVPQKILVFKTQAVIGDTKEKTNHLANLGAKDSTESWETIELGDAKQKEMKRKDDAGKDRDARRSRTKSGNEKNPENSNECCCVLQ